MASPFRKISRVGSFAGATKWYLSSDCLLAAKRSMYAVEYRRFYLRDLESIVVWPNGRWLLRPIIPGALLLTLGGLLWNWVNFIAGAIPGGIGLAWAALELVLGPTAKARIRTTGASIELPLVKRTRRARQVLEEIDAAVRAARGGTIGQVTAPAAQTGESSVETSSAQTTSAASSATSAIGDLT